MKDIYELIIDAYKRVEAGAKRFDIVMSDVTIKAYKAGTIIFIDIKKEEN